LGAVRFACVRFAEARRVDFFAFDVLARFAMFASPWHVRVGANDYTQGRHRARREGASFDG
jgi:hypothetical protein